MQKQTMLQTFQKQNKKSEKALRTWSNRNESCSMEREGKKGEKDV